MKWISYFLAVVLFILLGYFAFKDKKEGVSFKPAEKGEFNLTLESLDGKKVDLLDYRGNVVLVNFWATWCPPCREEMPMFEKIQQEYKDKKVRIVAVNMDTNESALKDYLSKNPFSFDVYKGNEEILKTLGISGFPTSYLLDKDGKVCKVRLGIYEELEKDIKDVLEKGGKC